MSHLKYFPVTRLVDYSSFNYYYAFDNTPPEDFLQSVTTDVSEPAILSLGCGDIRSCFYTLWNNFDQRHSRNFKGVRFVLNDNSAAVLARNIIFLYLCTKMPRDKDGVMNWVASFWSIWYCLELLPQHKQVLMDALSQLLQWSKSIKSWSEQADNPLRTLVQFTTPTSLSKIRRVWQMWYSDSRTVEQARAARLAFLKESDVETYHNNIHNYLIHFLGCFLYCKSSCKLSEAGYKRIQDEIEFYYQIGTVFAEKVLGLPVAKCRLTNTTLFESSDGSYTFHSIACPYKCFFHTFRFSPEKVKKLGYSGIPMLVGDDKFVHHPLLANSVQQFSLWIRSSAEILSKPNHISFTFHCSNAMEFCMCLQDKQQDFSCTFPHQFDAIHAADLIDFVSPPSLVLVAMPVLKQTGLLFTETFHLNALLDPSAGYLKSVFGFDGQHLPLICGIRCVDHDDKYSSEVSFKPVPTSAELDGLHCMVSKALIWQHAVATPLKQLKPKDFAAVGYTICAAVKHMLTCCRANKTCPAPVETSLCTETVILLLQSFVAQLDRVEYDYTSYKFWVPLCSLLLDQKCLKAFILSLQTQALLHGLHLHLMVTTTNCPVCCKKPVSSFINQYSLQVKNHPICEQPRVAVLLHRIPPVEVFILKTWGEIASGDVSDVHVFDALGGGIETNGNLNVEFFAPASLLHKGYQVSVISSHAFCTTSVVAMYEKLSNCKVTNHRYSFRQLISGQPKPTSSSLGTLLQHSGNVDTFESVMSLSDQCMSALEHSHLTTKQLNCRTIRIEIEELQFDICYPFPVDYGKISIKLSRKNKKLTIVAQRKCYNKYKEELVRIVNPDNVLSLPVIPISEEDLGWYSGFQYSPKEHEIMDITTDQYSLNPVELNVKLTLATLLQKSDRHYVQLICDSEPQNVFDYSNIFQCFMVIENRRFDLQTKSPVMDVHFCFLNTERCVSTYLEWFCINETEASTVWDICIDETERRMLEQIFNYFASCTVSTSKKKHHGKRHKQLVRYKIDHFFTRALVYPLYPNYNAFGTGLTKSGLPQAFSHVDCTGTPHSSEKRCSYCGKYSENLKKCSHCHSVQYCNQTCQRKHWGVHKAVCQLFKQD